MITSWKDVQVERVYDQMYSEIEKQLGEEKEEAVAIFLSNGFT